MKKIVILLFCIFPIISYSQVTIVAWNFEDGDNIADVAIALNNEATINRDDATSGVTIKYEDGYETGKAMKTNKFHSQTEDQFWKIQISTLGYTDLTLSSRQSGSSGSAPRNFILQYSLDNTNWNNVGDAIIIAQDWGGGFLDNVLLPDECSNKSTVYIRWLKLNNVSISENNVYPLTIGFMKGINIIFNSYIILMVFFKLFRKILTKFPKT